MTYPSVALSKLIEEFRKRTDELIDDDEIDTNLKTIVVDIDQTLGQIERAVSTFRTAFDDLIGRDG
jgi:hypothetical protein